MAQANAGNSEKLPHSSSTPSVDEIPPLKDTEIQRCKLKMRRISHFFFALLALALLSATLAYAPPYSLRYPKAIPPPASPESAVTEDSNCREFKELLNSVDPTALHEVLRNHLKDKYQHGVYREDRTAMEIVHQQDAEVAVSLIELAKRQSSNTSVVVTTPTSSVVVTTTTGSTATALDSSTAVVTSTPLQQTSQTPTSSPTSNAPTSASSSQAVVTSTAPTQLVSSTKSQVSDTTTTEGPKTSTNIDSSSSSSATSEGPSSILQTSASPSNTPTALTTKAGSSTIDQESSTTPSSITQEVVYKTTLANGAFSTVTSVTVVPGVEGDSNGGSSSKTNTAVASLQTGAASQNSLTMNVVAGALGLAAVAIL